MPETKGQSMKAVVLWKGFLKETRQAVVCFEWAGLRSDQTIE